MVSPSTTARSITNNDNGTTVNLNEMPTLSLKLANDLILEMESFIKTDLAMLEKFYTTDYKDVPFERAINKAKRKFEKRRGPLLIKPLNKTKKKMIVGDMEYDPNKHVWKGNYSDLNAFPNPPALITNMGKTDERSSVGGMKWDPNQKEWKGNEGDLTKFRFLKPALISQLTPNLDARVENGMVYDPVAMKWKGNEDALDVFETMDDQNNDNTFTVGKEFNLTPALIASFKKSSELHDKQLNGWFEKRDLTDREYLYSIRSMSIIKLIRSATFNSSSSNGNGSSSNLNGGNGHNQPMSPGGIIPLIPNLSKKKPVVDETKDWDDIDFQAKPALKLNLKIHHDAEDEAMMNNNNDEPNWDKEMGFTSEEETLSSNNENGGQTLSSSSQPHTPRKVVEEWSDFDNTMNSTITGKIIQLNKKGDTSAGGSLNNTSNSSLGNLMNFSGGSINNTSAVISASKQQLQLQLQHQTAQSSEDDDDFDWSDNNALTKTTTATSSSMNIIGASGGSIKSKKGGSLKGVFIGGSGSIRTKKGSDKSKRGGTIGNLQSLSAAMAAAGGNTSGNATTTPLSSSSSTIANGGGNGVNANDYYDDVFQVPSGSVFTLKNKPHQDNFEILMENGISSPKDEPCDETMRFFEREIDVQEEDWHDVGFTLDFGQKNKNATHAMESRKSPPIKGGIFNNTVEDYSDELDMPKVSQPLQLKKHLLIDNPFDDEDDQDENTNWDDISFPENPSQLISSTSKLQKPIPLNNNNTSSTTTSTGSVAATNNITSTTTTSTTSTTTNNISNLNNNIKSTNTTATNNITNFSTPSKLNNIKPNTTTFSTPSHNNNSTNFQTPTPSFNRANFANYTPKTIDEILKTPTDSPIGNNNNNSPFKEPKPKMKK